MMRQIIYELRRTPQTSETPSFNVRVHSVTSNHLGKLTVMGETQRPVTTLHELGNAATL